MGTPVDEMGNPFLHPDEMTISPLDTRENSGVVSSAETSQPQSRQGGLRAEKKRVGFRDGMDAGDGSPRISWVDPGARTLSPPVGSPRFASPGSSGRSSPSGGHSRNGSGSSEAFLPMVTSPSRSHLPELSPQQTQEIHDAITQTLNVPRPRPAIRRTGSHQSQLQDEEIEGPEDIERAYRKRRALEAHERGKRLEDDEKRFSIPNSRAGSPERHKPIKERRAANLGSLNDIPMRELNRHTSIEDDTDDEDKLHLPVLHRARTLYAQELVRQHTTANRDLFHDQLDSGLQSGAVTPTEEERFLEDYQPKPDKYRGGVLGSLLKLYNNPHAAESSRHLRSRSGDTTASASTTPMHSPPESGASTPTGMRSPRRSWYNYSPKHKNHSTSSLAHLIGSSASLGSPVISGLGDQVTQRLKEQKEERAREKKHKRKSSANPIKRFRPRMEDQIRITVHIAETIARQKYLIKLCRALMLYGAPTHRLEEYMRMSSRVLEIEAQFLYIPGAMIMSFDDATTHTTEVKLVKAAQGLDLGKLRDVHEVYKEVVHDRIGVEEATQRLNDCMGRKDKYNKWLRIFVYGLASVCVGPFAFSARLIDLPMAFLLGCILGILQLEIAPRSDLYANVFEISASVITSFLARALGSIPYHGGRLFCFSALAQSSIALILPGYIVLCAALELQSRSIVAGSVRMVYAIIYSLFLGFGITVGTAVYGLMDSNATSETQCSSAIPGHWFFFFVPGFALCLCIINQAKWKQIPVMILIAFVGYIVNFFSALRFAGNTQISNTLGALAIGVMANLYSRIGRRMENKGLDLWEDKVRPRYRALRKRFFSHQKLSQKQLEEGSMASDQESIYVRHTRRVGYGVAAAAMLPAIFVQVPSGIAVSGSLVSGIASANQITGNSTNGTQVVNTTALASGIEDGLNSIAFNVGYSVIQVAIGITVGLFLSAIVVYPFGKKRSGLFSF